MRRQRRRQVAPCGHASTVGQRFPRLVRRDDQEERRGTPSPGTRLQAGSRCRGHTEPACGSGPGWPAPACHPIDPSRHDNPRDGARPGLPACLAHPRLDYQERLTVWPRRARFVIEDAIPARMAVEDLRQWPACEPIQNRGAWLMRWRVAAGTARTRR
jgi:hypothetical protein